MTCHSLFFSNNKSRQNMKCHISYKKNVLALKSHQNHQRAFSHSKTRSIPTPTKSQQCRIFYVPHKLFSSVKVNYGLHYRCFSTNQSKHETNKRIAHALLNNPYQVLGVDSKASAAEIKASYTQKVKLYHPDVATGNKAQSTKLFIQIQEAYKVIGNEELRKQFDEELHQLQPKVRQPPSPSVQESTSDYSSEPPSWENSFRNLRNIAEREYREERRRQQAEFLTFQKYLKRFRNLMSVWMQAFRIFKEGPRFRFVLLDDCGRDGMGRYVSSDGRVWDEVNWQTFPLAFQLKESSSPKIGASQNWLIQMDLLDHHGIESLGHINVSEDTVELYTTHGHLFSVARRAIFMDEEVTYIYDQHQVHFATLQTEYERKRGLWASLWAALTSTQQTNYFKKFRQGVIDGHGVTLALDGVGSPFQSDFLWNQVVNNTEIFPVTKCEITPPIAQRTPYYINIINIERKVHPGVLISNLGFTLADRILLKRKLPSFFKK